MLPVAGRTEFIPSLPEIAAAIHAEQSLTFVARERRRLRSNLEVMFVLVPLHDLRHAEAVGQPRDGWLVWQDHTREGVVARIPAGAGEIKDAVATPDPLGRLAGQAVDEVMHAMWQLIAH